MVPTNTEVFCAVYDYMYVGKADLSKGYRLESKKKIGGNHAFFFRDN